MRRKTIDKRPPRDYEMIPANKDSRFMIRKDQENCFHVLQKRVTILPTDPLNPVVTEWVKVWRPCDWKFFSGLMASSDGGGLAIDPVKSAGLVSAKVVHDPQYALQAAADQAYREEKKTAIKKMKGQ